MEVHVESLSRPLVLVWTLVILVGVGLMAFIAYSVEEFRTENAAALRRIEEKI
jgi:hypothetical protein